MTIYAGDTPLIKLKLQDSLGRVDLNTGTLKLVVKNNASRVEKTGLTITNAVNGECQIRLAAGDLSPGTCTIQPVITYVDGREFAFSSSTFEVVARI